MNFLKSLMIASCALGSLQVNAQEFEKETIVVKEKQGFQNAVKLNLIPLVTSTISLEYERAIAQKITLNATVAFTPKGKLPFQSQFEDALTDADVLNEAKLGAFTATLEGRFYLGRKGAFRGFYVAPFVKYTDYDIEISAAYTDSRTHVKEFVPISGAINTVTFGFSLGAQWQLAKRITLDWRIMGPNYGFSSGTLEGKRALTPEDQAEVLGNMNNFNDIPFMKFKNEVNSQGAKSTISGPWAGIRTGLSLGFKF